jgi:HEAT repeat protein
VALLPRRAARAVRVRQRAQFALAARGRATTALLGDIAQHGTDRFARTHAIWALGQQANARLRESSALERQSLRGEIDPASFVLPILDDRDAGLRAQAARMLGEARCTDAAEKLGELCADDSARVRAFAALALGKLGAREQQPVRCSLAVHALRSEPHLCAPGSRERGGGQGRRAEAGGFLGCFFPPSRRSL